jgi:hypothetical protein
MADARTSRELETRAVFERPKQWQQPDKLPSPNPIPGWEFRYVRTSTLGVDDPMNISGKLREGWEPVRAVDHPELGILASARGRYPDSVEVGGLMLCKIPKEFMEQRAAYYQQQTDTQMNSIDNNFMRENDPRMPLFKERSSKVTFGKGT